MVREILLLLIISFNSFKMFQIMIFKELMKAFYAEFLLSNLPQKPEIDVKFFQLLQFAAKINLLQFSFVNLTAMIMNRYVLKLNIWENLKMSLLEILIFDFI